MDKKTYKLNGAGEITEVKHEAGPWPCDPLRNRDCTKVNCYLRGGECRLTYKQDCRREESTECYY